MQDKNKIIDTSHIKEDKWLEHNYKEGQLAIDVYETDSIIIIKSTIAGVDPQDLNISLSNDMLNIKGKRDLKLPEEIDDDNCLYQECYWGSFSRSIILPTEIDETTIDATLEDGVLTIILNKLKKPERIEVKVK